MPIYSYRCATCKHSQDHLQRLADPPKTACPVCSSLEYKKQLTTPAFNIEGHGVYSPGTK
jgi:putative FmdB family regulatory protein